MPDRSDNPTPTHQAQRPRFLIEGVVIVVSILLAFGIEAWWGERQERGEQLEILTTIRENVEASRIVLIGRLDVNSRDLDLASRFCNLPIDQLSAVPGDSARLMLQALSRPGTRTVSEGPLAGVLNSGQLSLIQDPQVRDALNTWSTVAREVDDRARNLEQLELVVLTALGRHHVFSQYWLSEPPILPPVVDLRPVRQDEDVVAAAAAVAQNRRVHSLFVNRLLETLDAIDHVLPPRR